VTIKLQNCWSDEGVFVLPRKVSKFSITSILCAFPDSVPVSVNGVL
jgi:hypothetical protein